MGKKSKFSIQEKERLILEFLNKYDISSDSVLHKWIKLHVYFTTNIKKIKQLKPFRI